MPLTQMHRTTPSWVEYLLLGKVCGTWRSMTTRRYAFRVWSSTMYRAHTEFHASSRRTSAKA